MIDRTSQRAAAVDPADHEAVLGALKKMKDISITQVWCTHKHDDHAGGNLAFATAYPNIHIYGPSQESTAVPGISHPCTEGTAFNLGNISVTVMHLPCHTRGHIAFYAGQVLCAGDTLFTGGCGRFFEGSAEEMLQNMDRLSLLPDETVCCPAHEYTLGNLAFNSFIDPDLRAVFEEVNAQRQRGQFTVPTTIAAEKYHNLFMRTKERRIQQLVAAAAGATYHNKEIDAVTTMSLLRKMKNEFKT